VSEIFFEPLKVGGGVSRTSQEYKKPGRGQSTKPLFLDNWSHCKSQHKLAFGHYANRWRL